MIDLVALFRFRFIIILELAGGNRHLFPARAEILFAEGILQLIIEFCHYTGKIAGYHFHG